MKQEIIEKLQFAEEILGYKLPKEIFEFISNLKKSEIDIRNETWIFDTFNDNPDSPESNFLVEYSTDLKSEWKLDGVVLAKNFGGDYLLLLPNKETGVLMETIFVTLHDVVEVKIIADSLFSLMFLGPKDYKFSEEFYVRLENDCEIVEWDESVHRKSEPGEDLYTVEQKRRWVIDEWIDEKNTDAASDILIELEKLTCSRFKDHSHWALNKLSNLYLKGFGPIPANFDKAFEYNQQAMDAGSHKAFSNRAACYFSGVGVEKDLHKALSLAKKANRLSRKDVSDYLFDEDEKGLYDHLIEMIKEKLDTEN